MAIGTVTIISTMQLVKGGAEIKCSFAGDGDYRTNGTPIADVEAAVELAIKTAAGIATDALVRSSSNITLFEVIPGDCGQYVPSITGAFLKVRDGGHATWNQIADHGNLSGTTFNVTFICK